MSRLNSSSNRESIGRIADIVGYVRRRGVRLWSEHGELRYKAPKGALTHEEFEKLRGSKAQILAYLERTGTSQPESKIEPRQQFNRAPLTFSQASHWHAHRLDERSDIRQLVSATQLSGRLDIGLLRDSLAEIVRRHEALRTKIVVLDGVPTQQISESGDCELDICDLTALSETAREIDISCLIARLTLEPIDVAAGRLCAICLAKLRDDDYILIVAMEHMIADAFSMNILLRDLFRVYAQLSQGCAPSLPAIPVQLADYAVWQKNSHGSWLEKHGDYWNQRLKGGQRLRFPQEDISPIVNCSGWGTVPLRIPSDLKAELREWCRLRRTTLVMSVFTAYVGLVLRWCNVSDAVLRYQTDGRANLKLENAIGYFASVLHLRIELLDGDSFLDLMSRVTAEYCHAHEHADFSYIDAQIPQPEFVRNGRFNWVPYEPNAGLSNLSNGNDTLASSRIYFLHPGWKVCEIDSEPSILLHDTGDEVVGGVHFPLQRFSVETMDRFARNFLLFIKELIRRPRLRVKDILLR